MSNSRFSLPNLLMKKQKDEHTQRQTELITAIDKAVRDHSSSVAEAIEVFNVLTSGYQMYAAKKTVLKHKDTTDGNSN